jgi:hypothetical protein
MRQLVASINDIKTKLLEHTTGCSFECRSAHLGALVIHIHDEKLLDGAIEPIEPPFEGRSVAETVTRMRRMRFPTKDWHMQTGADGSCELSLSTLTETALKTADTLQGLKLEDEEDCSHINSAKKDKRGKGKKR